MVRRVGWPVLAGVAVALQLVPAPVAAAVRDSTVLRLRVGPAFDAHSDLLVSPFRHHGTGGDVGLSATRGNVEVTFTAGLDRAGSRIQSSTGGYDDVRTAGLDVRWGHRVGSLAAGTPLALGVDVGALVLRRRHQYSPGFAEHFDDVAFPLAVSADVSHRLGSRGRVDERVDVGLLTAVLRSHYSGGGTLPPLWWGGPGAVRMVRHRIRVSWHTSGRMSFFVTHGLTFLGLNREGPLRVVRQDVSLGVSLLWRGEALP